MSRFDDLTPAEEDLVARFEDDPSSPYSMTMEECQQLLSLVGEYEPIIDAILKKSGASKRERAEQLGCRESDFDYEDEVGMSDDPIIDVDDAGRPLKNQWRSLWAKCPEGGD